jgi:hypothetical protein
MLNNNIQPSDSQFILCQNDNGVTNINIHFDGKDFWLLLQQIVILFDRAVKKLTTQAKNNKHETEK